MIYAYLFIAFALVGILIPFLSRFIRPNSLGLLSISGLSAVGVAVACSSFMSGCVDLGRFYSVQLGSVAFSCNPLSAWFLLIVSVLFFLGAFYGNGYLAHYNSDSRQNSLHWLSFSVTLSGMFILITTENLIAFLVGWEMMAIGSFFAVIYEYDKLHVVKAGLNYFIQSHVAVLLITAVFAWAISVSGRTSFAGLADFFSRSSRVEQYVAMSMLIIGFGFKAGFVPFHSWLPFAHPAAPSHISALMSGVIVKAGIFGIFRCGQYLSDAQMPIGVTLLVIGIVSGLYGILGAAEHRDFKRMLAYCTIENVGIIAMGLGIGFIGLANTNLLMTALGFGGALLHTLNHAIFKALLFFGAGNVYVSVHTRNMEELGGLGKFMPRTSLLFLIGCLAIGGLPPMGGFLSELLIYSGFVNGFSADGLALPTLMALAGCSLAIIGGVSMLAFTKTYGVIFLGAPRKQLAHQPSEVSFSMLWPAAVLVLLVALTLVFACHIVSCAFQVAIFTFNLNMPDLESLNHVVSVIRVASRAMLSLILVVVIMLSIRKFVSRRRTESFDDTWGCGYMKPITAIQYTSKSFSKTLLDMCRFVLPTQQRFDPVSTEEIFPKDRSHMSADLDFVDSSIIEPGTSSILNFLNRFQFIQNGNLQRYIVYGLGYTLILVASILIF